MVLLKKMVVIFVAGMTVFVAACSKKGPDGPPKNVEEKTAETVRNEMPNDPLSAVIRNGRLQNYKSKTIGKAFDSYTYLTKKEWKAFTLKSKHVTVDFIGWFKPETLNDKDIKAGVTGRGINVKFVIEPDGSYYVFMVSKIESRSDGKVDGYPIQDIDSVLADIYANKKISL